ncbi:immunoglobulin-like domain-containing protein [Listeria ilorinensis]|uniref:immunoglobulin-like domain-containing protein n=1 Tax=Listeria ilorinensis TaxID=2867439 RepID=UPI001EF707D5|nr:immunoglobulin-like domain-containing protein [Listeria ilorinensis]
MDLRATKLLKLALVLCLLWSVCASYATRTKAASDIYYITNQGTVTNTDSNGLRTFEGDIKYDLPNQEGKAQPNDIVIIRDISLSFNPYFFQSDQILTNLTQKLDLTKDRVMIWNSLPPIDGNLASNLSNNPNVIANGIQNKEAVAGEIQSSFSSGIMPALSAYEAQKGSANTNTIFLVISDDGLLDQFPTFANDTLEAATKVKDMGYNMGVIYAGNNPSSVAPLASNPDYFVNGTDIPSSLNMLDDLLTNMLKATIETIATWNISNQFDLIAATATDETGQKVPVQINGNQLTVTTTHTDEKHITIHYTVKEKTLLTEKTSIGQGTISSSLGEEPIPEVFLDGGKTNTKPEIAGPDVTLYVGEKFDPMSDMKATDKEDGDITKKLQVADNPVDIQKAGIYTVKYQVTDSDKNTTTFERKVTVLSNEKPVITGDKETTIKVGATFDPMSTMHASDKEDGDLTSKLQVTGQVDPQKIGDYLLTYTVEDSQHNQTTFKRTVHVVSNEKPVITGEKESSIKVGTTFDPMSTMHASDKEDGDLTKQLTVSGQVDPMVVGDYTLTYHVTDSDDNTATFTRLVHVLSNDAPVILGEPEVRLNPGSPFDPLDKMAASDKEDGDLTAQLKVLDNPVNTKVPGTYEVKYQVTDSDDNTTTFTKTVIVTEAPVIAGVKEIRVNPNSPFDPMREMTASDKEDGDLTAKLKVLDNPVNTKVPGTYEVKYQVTDSDDNTTTFTKTVIVTEAPVIAGVKEIRVNPNSTFDPMREMTASDKEDGDLTAQLKVLDNPVNTKVPGTYEVKYQVTDSDGNTATFTKTVIVTEAPVIAGVKEIRVNPNSTFDPFDKMTASDKEDGDLTAALKVLTNDVNTKVPGTYHVTYQVTDSDGNQATFEQTVIVTHAPTIEASDQTIQQGASFDPLKVVKASDKEDGDLSNQVVVKQSNVDPQVPGIYQVTYMVKDKDGNWAEKTIQVTVQALPKKETPAPQVVSSPVKPAPKPAALPKTGDSSEWPWPAAGAALLVMSLSLLAVRKKN